MALIDPRDVMGQAGLFPMPGELGLVIDHEVSLAVKVRRR